jgi:hypothetical protein
MMTNPAFARRERFVVLALTLLATLPRIWALDRFGLSQFDEGEYAVAGLWS